MKNSRPADCAATHVVVCYAHADRARSRAAHSLQPRNRPPLDSVWPLAVATCRDPAPHRRVRSPGSHAGLRPISACRVAPDRDWRADARRCQGRSAVEGGPLTLLVVDASSAAQACLAADGFDLFGDEDLVAPPLLWSEASAVIHELRWRRQISDQLASTAFEALLTGSIVRRAPMRLHREAWRVADDLGWAKTYDAEYVALARILGCRLFTVDDRLRRGARRIVDIIGPQDL